MAGSLGSPESFDALDRVVADERVHEAARARARRASLEVQAGEEATFRGVLVDLGERGAPLRFELDANRSTSGTVAQVGLDHVQVRTSDGRLVLVALDAMHAVLPVETRDAVVGDRATVSEHTLRHALDLRCGDRPWLLVRLRSGGTVEGELCAVGRDVVTLLVGPTGRRGHIRLAAVAEVWP